MSTSVSDCDRILRSLVSHTVRVLSARNRCGVAAHAEITTSNSCIMPRDDRCLLEAHDRKPCANAKLANTGSQMLLGKSKVRFPTENEKSFLDEAVDVQVNKLLTSYVRECSDVIQ